MNQIKEQSLLARMINDNPDSQFLIADGFDEAVIGYDYQTDRLIYSYNKCLDILMQDETMSYEDAVEWMGCNVMDSYMGDKTPIWCINN